MISLITQQWRSIAFRGLLTLLFGIITLFWPGISLSALGLLFGAFALVNGIALLQIGASMPSEFPGRAGVFFQGIAGIAAGILAFFWPGVTALALLIFLIAGWAIISGTMEISFALALRKTIEGEWLMLFTGVLSILFGLVIAMNPYDGAYAIMLWIGIFAFIVGAALLMAAFRLRSLNRTILRP